MWWYVEVYERYQAKRELTGRRVRGKVFNGNWAAIQTVRYYRRWRPLSKRQVSLAPPKQHPVPITFAVQKQAENLSETTWN